MTGSNHSNTMKITKGVLVGMIIGGALCAVAMGIGAMKPKKKSMCHKAACAIDTVASVMQNIADFAR